MPVAGRWLLAGLLLLTFAGPAGSGRSAELPPAGEAAPVSTAAPLPTETQKHENQPLFGSHSRRSGHPPATPSASSASGASRAAANAESPASPRRVGSSAASKLFWVVAYLTFIGGLLWLGLKAFKKYVPGSQKYFTHPSLEVLGRTQIDPRRYLSLVRVGRRLLVVGVSPEGLHGLGEITDEAEVTEIMETARPKTEAGKNVFLQMFQRQCVRQEAEQQAVATAANAEQLSGQVSDLRERVRTLRDAEQ